MAGGRGISFSALLLWRIGLGVAVIAAIAAALSLWMSGSSETDDALQSGRRLMVSLETGEITGKRLSSDDLPKAESAKPDEETDDKEKKAEPDEKRPEDKPVEEKPEEDTSEAAPEAVETGQADPAPEQPETPEPTQETDMAEEPKISLPESSEGSDMSDDPAAPQPLTYENLPAPTQPEGQSTAPAVLPSTANKPPLSDIAPPEVTPAKARPAERNALLIETSPEGEVPVVAADGTRAWQYYARPYAASSRGPMIAIIVKGLGKNKRVTQHALALPDDITLVFSPYASDIVGWTKSAQLAGHETMLELPMQPVDYPATDPGPYGLLLKQGVSENERKLRWLMARMPNSIGFATLPNEVFSASSSDFNLLLKSIGNRGLMLLYAREPSNDVTRGLLQDTSTPNVITDVMLDEELVPELIQKRFYELEQVARQKGHAVGTLGPYPLSIEQLKLWIATLEEKGITLVPVSAIAKLDF